MMIGNAAKRLIDIFKNDGILMHESWIDLENYLKRMTAENCPDKNKLGTISDIETIKITNLSSDEIRI